ncbi:MAG TPA: hypothetical protein VF482_07235 [Trebonia sp.]
MNAFSALDGNGSPTWYRRYSGITPSLRSAMKVWYDVIASSTRGQESQCSSVTPGRMPNTGVSYACRGSPVGDSVSCSTTMPGFGRTRRSRS